MFSYTLICTKQSSPCLFNPHAPPLIVRPTTSLWLHRLSHASTEVVQQVLSHHNLSFVKDLNDDDLYYNGPIKIILYPLRKTSHAESHQSLCT